MCSTSRFEPDHPVLNLTIPFMSSTSCFEPDHPIHEYHIPLSSIKLRNDKTFLFRKDNNNGNTFTPAGMVSPKLSRILSQKGAVSPPPVWINKFEPTVTQNPMTIRRFFNVDYSDCKIFR
ncbi:hypothetical protein AVEN_208983-1 [Araneus ventricosus]|uniref:Uncharacterized protein n=1 Tax=Araneus ventricosus TaxID=182803 RepID=A0A4Y2CPG4_ARAVE|nr:hypothetical protein AVEN_208983-1 [Araneus ventricosus]